MLAHLKIEKAYCKMSCEIFPKLSNSVFRPLGSGFPAGQCSFQCILYRNMFGKHQLPEDITDATSKPAAELSLFLPGKIEV